MSGALAAISSIAGSAGATQGIGMVASAASSMSQMQAARSQARGLAAQATMARLQAKTESLKYKQQGLSILDNILQTQAAINARAGAGGVDPTSGSAVTVQQFAMGEGVTEFNIAADNAALALSEGYTQAGIYRSAGSTARKSADVAAIGSLGEAAYMGGQLL